MEAKLYRTKKPTGKLGLSLSEYGRACMVLVTPGLNASVITESFPNLGCAIKEKI